MKRGEGKQLEEEVVGTNLLPALAEYLASSRFQGPVDDFYRCHLNLFEQVVEAKSEEDVEFSHEHKEAFDRFESLLDSLFEKFAEKEDVAAAQVYQCCKDAEDDNKWIVDTLMSYMDFHSFLSHMRRLGRVGERRHK